MPLPSTDEVHVWAIDLALTKPEVDALAALLSADELRRAADMRVEGHRRRWMVTRAGLRRLIGDYLDREPDSLAFEREPRGKPRLEPRSPLRFNVAHSGELALVAVANEREVGVDVEWARASRDALGLAARYFAAAERAAVEEAPEAERLATFYRHWVSKEAFVKATGRGLAASLRSFEVDLAGPSAPRLVHVGGDPVEALRWSLELLEAPPGYTAALAVEAPARSRPIAGFDPLKE